MSLFSGYELGAVSKIEMQSSDSGYCRHRLQALVLPNNFLSCLVCKLSAMNYCGSCYILLHICATLS